MLYSVFGILSIEEEQGSPSLCSRHPTTLSGSLPSGFAVFIPVCLQASFSTLALRDPGILPINSPLTLIS